MNADPMIRAITRDDAASVRRIAVAAEMFPASEAAFLLEMIEDHVVGGGNRNQQGGEWLVAELNGKVVAATYHCPVEATDRAWHLKMIVVDPTLQRSGIGRAMMAEVERRLINQQARILFVETSATPSYDQARAFYASLRYQEEARVRDFYADGDDMVLMRKRL